LTDIIIVHKFRHELQGFATLWSRRLHSRIALKHWASSNPVDVCLSDQPNLPLTKAKRVSITDRDGRHEVSVALGSRRYKDYHLSTTYRRPEYEMPRFDAAAQAASPVAAFFANDQKDPAAAVPSPLFDANRRAFLEVALDEVETKWGSVDKYLAREVGIGPVELARLRAIYLQEEPASPARRSSTTAA
jgi:hypothetical protein